LTTSKFHSIYKTLYTAVISALSTVIKAYITIAIRLRHDYDTMIPQRTQLWWKWLKLRLALNSTAIRLRHDYDEKLTCPVFARVASCRMESGTRDTS